MYFINTYIHVSLPDNHVYIHPFNTCIHRSLSQMYICISFHMYTCISSTYVCISFTNVYMYLFHMSSFTSLHIVDDKIRCIFYSSTPCFKLWIPSFIRDACMCFYYTISTILTGNMDWVLYKLINWATCTLAHEKVNLMWNQMNIFSDSYYL